MRADAAFAEHLCTLRQQLIDGLVRMIVAGDADLQNLLEADARLDPVGRQVEDFQITAVEDFKPVLRVVEAQALRHILERRVEQQVGLAQRQFLRLQAADVAAQHDEALVAGRAAADAQPASVRHRDFGGGADIAVTRHQDAAGVAGRLQRRLQPRQRRAGLEQARRDAEEIRGLRVGEHDAVVGIHHHDAFLGIFQRVGKPRLRGTALRDLAVHHRLDVVAHHAHGGEQRAEFVAGALGDRDVELAGGDALGDVGGDRDRPDDAPRQRPGDQRREQQRQRDAGDVELDVVGDRGAGALPVQEAVAGGVVHQEIDLVVDLDRVLVERRPVDVELGAVEEPLANASPGVHRALDALGGAGGAHRLRALRGDREVFRQRGAELVELVVQRRAHVGIGGDPAPRECRAHGGEIGRRRAGVIDRHQRFVEGLVDQQAGIADAHGGVGAERRGDHAHDQERDQDAAADGHAKRGGARRALAPRRSQTDDQTSDPATHHEGTITDFGRYRPIPVAVKGDGAPGPIFAASLTAS